MVDSNVDSTPTKLGGVPWVYVVATFLIGLVVGDVLGGGDWTNWRNRRNEVLKVLGEQQEAWNRGDLDRFMDSYWKSDQLTFFSGADVTRGWRATFDRYDKRYRSEGKEMGALAFSELEVLHVDDKGAGVRGRFSLQFRDGKTSSGRFTLLLRRIDGHWKIVHDQTASDAPPAPPAPGN